MKNHRLTISFILLGGIFVSMSIFVLISRAAQTENLKNPYDSANLSVSDIVATYHNNMNDAFNRYIKLMITGLQKDPDDPKGKAFHVDSDGTPGDPFTVEECYAAPDNYSTFCVAANLLGGNSDACDLAETSNLQLADDMKAFCNLGGDAQALKGYFNFVAALKKKQKLIFDTEAEKSNLEKYFVDSPTAIKKIVSRDKIVSEELSTAKNTLDQALSAYDQLRVAWPMHQKYVEIYAELEKYRDKIVEIRHATDMYPGKFIDLTTTSCT